MTRRAPSLPLPYHRRQDSFAGLRDCESSYALAGLLDVVVLHFLDVPAPVLWQAMHAAQQITRA